MRSRKELEREFAIADQDDIIALGFEVSLDVRDLLKKLCEMKK